MYYQNPIDYNSQTSSPMPNQGVLPPEVMSRPYDMEERRSAPSPPEFQHFGSYGVSGSHSASDTPSSYYYHNPVVRHEPNAYPLGLHPEGSRPLVSLPLLGQPQATQSRQPRQRGEEVMVLPDNVAAPKAPFRDTPSKRAAQPSRVRKRPARKGSSGSRTFGVEAASAADHLDCHGEERQPLLNPDTPEEERLIMDLRWRYRNSKGQDMWDSIQREYHRAFQKDCPKEQLQMKYKRARARYFQWQERDIQLLVEAYLEVERSRYSRILEKFLERGGSRNMQLSASDIEAKLVNGLKLEEGLYIDHPAKSSLKVRRRRKLSARARQGKPGDNSAAMLREETSLPGLRQATDPEETLHQIQERDAQAANGSWPGASGLSPGMTSCHVQSMGQAAVPLQHGERADFPGKSNKRGPPRRST
ncbi:uncharacterized protein J7T54_004374 [Emericellopsis cladophorae]|uniref:Uncharacterized protein n=1 Tax=Emericellopsis cladophorae TaxID=2686198 RepID=A0A9Q0BEW5_9HYPO|nr:uncharacterized protein J7T54_004374 [Emericellopsis cladophorae]KAI6783347.1 hypothetical protein J7T54_004374 [Emericellopsis cladophorae]